MFTVILLVSCEPPVQEMPESGPDRVREQFVSANQYLQQRHQDHISAFVNRVGWEATVTPSGLWIVTWDKGKGERIDRNDRVTYTYETRQLDGTFCYRATRNDPKVITVGRGDVESGMQEGLQKLREGARATFLIPPHLGHGNFGDREKIPGNTVLIIDVQVLEVN